MKRCPNCKQLFTDDNSFCLEDGTMLVFAPDTAQNPQVFPTPGEMPTQFIQTPLKTASPQNAAKDSSKWLFLVIGVLATALAAVVIFIFINPGGENKTEAGNISAKTTENSSETNRTTENLPKNEQSYVNTSLKNVPAPRPTLSNTITSATPKVSRIKFNRGEITHVHRGRIETEEKHIFLLKCRNGQSLSAIVSSDNSCISFENGRTNLNYLTSAGDNRIILVNNCQASNFSLSVTIQ